ncbi:MAG: OmpA family protein [bacterium]|nr:OmpA family protein [bacterium]
MRWAFLIAVSSLFILGCFPKKKVVKEEVVVPEEKVEVTKPEVEPEVAKVELNRINFDFDKYDIRPGDAKILENNAKVLREHPDINVLIEGHCCEIGTAEYNMALGWKRAKAAKDYLINLGIKPDRLSTISYGEERPLDPRDLPKNRRAEFVIK